MNNKVKNIFEVGWVPFSLLICFILLYLFICFERWLCLIGYAVIGIITFFIIRLKNNSYKQNWLLDLSTSILIWPFVLLNPKEFFMKNISSSEYEINDFYDGKCYDCIQSGIKAQEDKNYSLAVVNFTKAHSISIYDPHYYYLTGKLYLGLGKDEPALRNLLTYTHLCLFDDSLLNETNISKSRNNLAELNTIISLISKHYQLSINKMELILIDNRINNIISDSDLLFMIGFLFIINCEQFRYEQFITDMKIQDTRNWLLGLQNRQILKNDAASRIIKIIGLIGILENIRFDLKDKNIIISYYISDTKKIFPPLEEFEINNKNNLDERDKNRYILLTLDGAIHLEEKDDCIGAIELFNESLKLNNSYGATYLFRGKAYLRLGRIEEAKKDFKDAVTCTPLLENEIPVDII